MTYRVEFEPIGRRGAVEAGRSLLEAARRLGVDLVNLCGGQGTCGRCRVRLVDGSLSPITSSERRCLSQKELAAGVRLACQAYPRSDVVLSVPPASLSSPQRTQVEGREVAVTPDPVVRSFPISLTPPSLDDLAADAERVRRALDRRHGVACDAFDVELLRDLSSHLRAWDWQAAAALRGGECVALFPRQERTLGLAVDLGTTKIAGYLIDLQTGEMLASRGVMNPQIAYGEDVIARITRAEESPGEARRLQRLVVTALAELAQALAAQVGRDACHIVDCVVVGNTAMHHLFLGLPVRQLALVPYVPAVAEPLDVKARDVGLPLAPGAYVHLLPNIAGYVGADHVAAILGTQLAHEERTVLLLDIGTNTEICLQHAGRMASVSCASGPAFEGAHVTCGMRAADGAIEHLRLEGDRVIHHTIGAAPPVGLCGSGVLDALAQLHLAGVVDRRGRMHEHPRVRERDGRREFVLVDEEERGGEPAITFSQRDVRQLQLAKGAIWTGIRALLHTHGLATDDVEQVLIAGAFGTYIDVASGIAIGMLPDLPPERFRQVGNAAGTGARLALVSRERRAEAAHIARHVQYVELAGLPQFHEWFMASMYLDTF